MQWQELLSQTGGLKQIARELGVNESQATDGAAALLPAILGGFKTQAQSSSGGLAGLTGMLGKVGGGGLLDNVLGSQQTDVGRGNDVLGQIFGSKDVSRTVADSAAAKSGVDASTLKKMLPMLAMLVGGFLSKQGGATQAPTSLGAGAGGLGGLVGGLLGGAGAGGGGAANRAAGAGGGALGGLGSLLDMNGDGNALDDIMRLANKLRT